MQKIIYKYALEASVEQAVMVSKGAKFLSVQVQNGVTCVWALVDLAEPMEARTFTVLATGEAREGAFFFENRYVGTFLNGAFVGHLFERIG